MTVLPVQDLDHAHPIATAWRPMLSEIVLALSEGDYRLSRTIPGVSPVDEQTAMQVHEYLEDYGATLTALPAESWATSCAQWMGSYWDVLIDLWTKEEGASDLVLCGRMRIVDQLPVFTVELVYVP